MRPDRTNDKKTNRALWTVASSHSKKMLAAARAGVPLDAFNPHYALPEGLIDPPTKIVKDIDAEIKKHREQQRQQRLLNQPKRDELLQLALLHNPDLSSEELKQQIARLNDEELTTKLSQYRNLK